MPAMHDTPAEQRNWRIICATGHRPQHLSKTEREWTREKLLIGALKARDQWGTTVGISGMALGVDLWWADAVIRAGLILGAYVPCRDQPRKWTSTDRAEWRRLLDLADPVYSRTIADEYSPKAMDDRNEAMLDASSAVFAVWVPRQRHGGTYNALRSAIRRRMPGLHLDPSKPYVHPCLPDLSRT